MQEPSENWRKLQRATLERVQRNAIETLERVNLLYLLTIVGFWVGFSWLGQYEQAANYSLLQAVGIFFVGACGLLVPIFTGSVVALYYSSTRLNPNAN